MPDKHWFQHFAPRLAWLFAVVALVLAAKGWLYFSAYQESHAQERQSAAEHQIANADQGVEACWPIMNESGFVAWLTCFAKAEDAAQDAAYTEHDLKAQQDMAEWALLMVFAAWATFIVTSAGVLYVRKTLHEAITTNKAATDATVAAHQTNEIMRHEQRPWITVDAGKCGRLKVRELSVESFGIGFNLKNIGKSPARNIRASAFPVHYRVSATDILNRTAPGFTPEAYNRQDWPSIGFLLPDDDLTEALYGTSHANLGGLGARDTADMKIVVIVEYEYGAVSGGNSPERYWASGAFRPEVIGTKTLSDGGNFGPTLSNLQWKEIKSERDAG